MEAQKNKIIALFEGLGFEKAVATAKAEALLTPAEGKEPELEVSEVLLQAQKYAKPLLKRELSSEFKGQYMGDALGKIVAASKGKIRRADYEDGNIEKALADMVSHLEAKDTSTDTEKDQTINDLRAQIAALTSEKETAVNAVRSEYAERENGRLIYDTLLSKLGALQNPGEGKIGKKLTVDQAHAAKAILRELGDDYILKYDEATKDIGVFDKKNPEQRVALPDNSRFVNANELIEQSLSRNKWIAESNGSLPNNNLGNLRIGGKANDTPDVKYPDQNTKALAENLQKHLPAA